MEALEMLDDPMEYEAKQHKARNKRREKQAKNNYNH
jgi:hypothetical protein